MLTNRVDGLTYYQFRRLAERGEIVHAVSGRSGGRSVGPFASLDVSYAVGDEPTVVEGNRAMLCAALRIDPRTVVCAEQVHGNLVARVGRSDVGHGYANPTPAIAVADALITDEPDVHLWLTFADCVPILLHDVARRAVGLVHAGWRGTVGHIVSRTVEAMGREFGTRPTDLLAGIGPAIGPCCYQVGAEVAAAVRTAFPGDADLLQPTAGGGGRFDLPGANARLLARLGVLPENVERSEYCTACRTDLFFSHRAEGGLTGRMAAVIGIRP